ncbi:MAG TPA: hypothetical protein V6C89_00520 [Drouetiella sp.]
MRNTAKDVPFTGAERKAHQWCQAPVDDTASGAVLDLAASDIIEEDGYLPTKRSVGHRSAPPLPDLAF